MALRRFHGLSNNLRALQIRKLKDVSGRIIIVGDVHGCPNEFDALVSKSGYSKENGDVLLLVGDFVNKGYNSIGLIRRCIELGAYGVLGNHDFTLLHVADSLNAGINADNISNQLSGTTAKKDAVLQLAREMPHEYLSYLRQLPHIIRIPQHNVIVVHAGINVAVPIEQQDIYDVLHIRTIVEGRDGIKRGSCGGDGQPWADLYEGPEQIVFGHDARTGFKEYKHALALDSGCVYGNCLSAVIYDAASPMKGKVIQVASEFNAKAVASTPATTVIAGGAASTSALVSAAINRGGGGISPGDSPAPLVMSTHAIQQEVQRGFVTNAAVSLPPSSFATPPSLPPATGSVRSVRIAGEAPTATVPTGDSESPTILALMRNTVSAFVVAGMLDSLAVLSKVPGYSKRWEDVLGGTFDDLQNSDWEGVLEKLFQAVLNISNGVFEAANSFDCDRRVSSSFSSPYITEEEQLVSYLNLITDIIDARGEVVVEKMVGTANVACDAAKKKFPSQARLIKQVKLALP